MSINADNFTRVEPALANRIKSIVGTQGRAGLQRERIAESAEDFPAAADFAADAGFVLHPAGEKHFRLIDEPVVIDVYPYRQGYDAKIDGKRTTLALELKDEWTVLDFVRAYSASRGEE